jgi:mono/diheme cytochrome c family protein
MTFERVRIEERRSARSSRLRHVRAAGLNLTLAVLAVAFAACKKTETATPSDQPPADTATTSQTAPAGSATEPAAPAAAPAEETPAPAASETSGLATSVRSAEAAPAPAPPSAAAPEAKAPAAPPAPAPPAAPEPAAAPAPPAPPATPEASAPADTPSAGSQAQPTGGQQPAGGQGPKKQASLDATPEVYEGWKHFSANCERCHGQDAVGSSFAPSLIKSIQEGSVLGTGPLSHDLFIGTVVAGRPSKGMPSWAQLLDREKMENIWAYLSARASGELAPGRPVKKGG